MAALKPCSVPGCAALSEHGGRCEQHRKQHYSTQQRAYYSRMGHSDRSWRETRRRYLADHPLCADPFREHGEKHLIAAEILDHVQPHRGDARLCFDPSNWQGLCRRCNDRKTAIDHGWSQEKNKPEGGGVRI